MSVGTRAVAMICRRLETCSCCGCSIRGREMAVVCNVYVRGKWDRLEWWHQGCYEASGEPYGPAEARPRGNVSGNLNKLRTCRFCSTEFMGVARGKPTCPTCRAGRSAA